jgi:hypothetical protein
MLKVGNLIRIKKTDALCFIGLVVKLKVYSKNIRKEFILIDNKIITFNKKEYEVEIIQ